MRIRTLTGWVQRRTTMLLAVSSIGVITLFVTLFELESLVPGANRYEVETAATLQSLWSSPLQAIIDAPYFVLAWLFDLIFSQLLAQRLASATLGVATIMLLGYILRQWFNNRIAIAGTLFIVTSSWYLHLARIGAPFMLSAFWLTLLLALGTWRTYTTKPLLTDIIVVIAAALSIYTPYFIWIVAISLVVLTLRRRKEYFIRPRKHQILLPVIAIALIAPLLYAILKQPTIIRELIGLQTVPDSFLTLGLQFGQNISAIFFRGFSDPSLNLGRLALLDIFSVVMVALGVIYFERQRGLRRSQLLFGALLLLGAIVSITPFAFGKLSIFFPLIMILAVAGIVELLQRWLKSFPRNPIARSVGVCVIVIAIGFSSHYHLQRYFIAWAGNPDVVEAHSSVL